MQPLSSWLISLDSVNNVSPVKIHMTSGVLERTYEEAAFYTRYDDPKTLWLYIRVPDDAWLPRRWEEKHMFYEIEGKLYILASYYPAQMFSKYRHWWDEDYGTPKAKQPWANVLLCEADSYCRQNPGRKIVKVSILEG